jgi:alpha-tubulin suppressor-like RCC1 family protein
MTLNLCRVVSHSLSLGCLVGFFTLAVRSPLEAATPMVDLGSTHVIALRADGTVWAWGSNASGQLGIGATPGWSNTPIPIPALTDVAAISSAGSHTLALKSDGTLWAWGLNMSGQLGDNSTVTRTTPVQITGVTSPVIAIAAGTSHSLALAADGTVWAWGLNTNGQLGLGNTTTQLVPVQIPTIVGATMIAAGGSHSIAAKSNNTVVAWGLNSLGQIGDNTVIQRTAPVVVSGLTAVSALSLGTSHSLALLPDGTP